MKKSLQIMLSALLLASILTGCAKDNAQNPSTNQTASAEQNNSVGGQNNQIQEDTIDIMISADFSYLGLLDFYEKTESDITFENKYNIVLEDSIDDIVTSLKSNTVDIAAIPLDVATNLQNSGDVDINILAILNIGGVYLVQNSDVVQTMEDLAGKTIYSLGEYSSNQTHIEYILSENGVDVSGIKFEYVDSYDKAFELENAIVVMNEPNVTTALQNFDNASICLDLASEWDKIQIENDVPAPFITSVIVADSDFVAGNKEIITEFLNAAYESTISIYDSIVAEFNPFADYGISKEVVDNTQITYIPDEDMMHFAGAYLYVLDEYDSQVIGGSIPGDDFYYMSY